MENEITSAFFALSKDVLSRKEIIVFVNEYDGYVEGYIDQTLKEMIDDCILVKVKRGYYKLI